MTRGTQGEFGLQDTPLGKIEVTDSMLADVVHLVNVYFMPRYRLDENNKANAQTGEFHTLAQ